MNWGLKALQFAAWYLEEKNDMISGSAVNSYFLDHF